MPTVRFLRNLAAAAAVAAACASPVFAQDGKQPDQGKAKAAEKATVEKAAAEKSPDADAARYCASVTPSIAEARIARQAKRLTELDAQIQQRIAELQKAEASAREWIAKRDELMKAARDDLVAIYAKMEPESAARQLSALDDRTAAAILGKLKPGVAGAILGEMETGRASRLQSLIAGAGAEEKKS